MSLASGVENAALGFLQSHGYVALFVLMALETAMLLHFVPSEAIIPVATALLATSPAGLALVILVSTLGSTAGALLLYGFARGGGRGFLEKHGHFFGLTPERREKLERSFQRPAGESTVFFFRLLPVVRAIVSIPAGLARMDWRKFTLYSATGGALFNAAIAYSTYAAKTNPDVIAQVQDFEWYASTRWAVLLVSGLALVAAAVFLYSRRGQYARAPHRAVRHVLNTAGVLGVLVGIAILGAALLAPHATYRAVTWVAVDLGEFVDQTGLSPLLVLVGVGLLILSIGLGLLTVRPILERVTRVLHAWLKGKPPRQQRDHGQGGAPR